MTEILPPLILHDGSPEAHRMVALMTALCPDLLEVIDATTAAGRARIRFIERSLKNGTLDTRCPPLALGDPAIIFPERKHHGRN